MTTLAKINWIAFKTIINKEVTRFMRIWIQTLVPPIITTALYFVIFGQLIGSRIGEMHGFPYMQYITPGLIMMSVITNAYANVVGSFYGMRFNKSVEELLVSPVLNSVILLGFVAGGVLRGLLTGLIVTGVALFFTKINVEHWLIMLVIAILSATLFALAGFLNAVYARNFDDITIIPTFVLTPLTYLGGIFYSIDMLPQLWQNVSLANPILYMINAFRFGVLGVSDVPLSAAFGIILVFIVLLFAVNLRLLRKGTGIKP